MPTLTVLWIFAAILGSCTCQGGDLTAGQGGFGTGLIPFNCPAQLPSTLPLQLPVSVPAQVLPCDQDCQSNHGAQTGACNSAGQCICNYNPTTVAPNGTRVPIAYSSQLCTGELCQCAEESLSGIFDAICDGDCSCNHGANYGTCDYVQRVCRCNYDQAYNGTCAVRDLAHPETYPAYALRLYAAMEQAAQFQNIVAVAKSYLTNHVCLPAVLPLSGLVG